MILMTISQVVFEVKNWFIMLKEW